MNQNAQSIVVVFQYQGHTPKWLMQLVEPVTIRLQFRLNILLIGPLGTNFSEILIEIYIFSSKKMHLKM